MMYSSSIWTMLDQKDFFFHIWIKRAMSLLCSVLGSTPLCLVLSMKEVVNHILWVCRRENSMYG